MSGREKILAGDLRGPQPIEDFSLLEEPRRIRSFDDIPDILTMQIKPVEWIVDGFISRKSMTLWTGTDGTAKTFMAQALAVAVATGGEFLGRRCRQSPLLYLDYENTDHVVRDRLDVLAGGPIPALKVWGMWLDPQPVPIGSELLLKIARETAPLMIFDPFRYAHPGDENDSTEMVAVMRHLRSYATAGAAVVILHHPAKAEGSTGRGSSAIRGACDVSYLQELSDETGLITLTCGKNRFGEKPVVYIRPDFDAGIFEVVDSPTWTKRKQETERLRQIIAAEPGLSQKQVIDKAGLKRERGIHLLKEHTGRLWNIRAGSRNSTLYFPPVPSITEQVGTTGTGQATATCSPVPTLKGGTGGNSVAPTDRTCSARPDDDEREDLKF